MTAESGDSAAIRATVRGRVQGVGFREAAVDEARRLGATGWVRNEEDGSVRVHAEGAETALEALAGFLGEGPPGALVESVETEIAKVEGHEQFAVRGVSAGRFAVIERREPPARFDLCLEVGGALRSWALPRGPSMDPAVRRLAVEIEGPDARENGLEGAEDDGGAIVWDRGRYEQGGRVPWPEALERGHAVFVLHGEKLRGGFALQRTDGGERPRWLLVKRRDEAAAPGSG